MITEENTVTTATTPISDATQTSLHSLHENEVTAIIFVPSFIDY